MYDFIGFYLLNMYQFTMLEVIYSRVWYFLSKCCDVPTGL